MPFYSEETLQAVRSIPLYDIVRPVVELSRSGKNWRGLSPFSNEKTPSFYVLTDRNYFKCHSTGLAGDGISFIQETEKLTFPEAVEALAERFNVPVKYASGAEPDQGARSLRQALLDIHEYARDYYHTAFMADHPISEKIRRYWVEERGFSLELAEEFSIGFSPPDSRKLIDLLKAKGFQTEALAKSGLFHVGRQERDPSTWFFVFRGRLMVPIRDLQGHVVAFTARQLEETPRDHGSWKAKYINSPETPIFRKSQLLFNLDRAKDTISEAGRALLVEGQLDALRCWSCGLREAAAPQGTSITQEQLDLLKRYTDRLDVLLDNDAAGSKAVLRLLPMAFKSGLEVHVIDLPEGEDPDDFLRHKGAAGLGERASCSGIQFAGLSLLGENKPSPEQRSKVLNALFEMLASCPSAVVREGYFLEAVEATGTTMAAAKADYDRFFSQAKGHPARTIIAPSGKRGGTISSETLTNLEGDLLWALLKNVEWADSLAQVIDHQWIRIQNIEGKLLSRILAEATVDHIESSQGIYFLMRDDEERACLARYETDDRQGLDMESFVNQTLAALVRRYCRDRVEYLDKEISRHGQSNIDAARIRDFMKERRELKLFIQNGPFPHASLSETSEQEV
ncbi:MAG: DNA primase [Opitutales bacterium]|jgi:DNA primase